MLLDNISGTLPAVMDQDYSGMMNPVLNSNSSNVLDANPHGSQSNN